MFGLPSEKEMSGRKIDFSNCNKNIWLVKIPKYITENWSNCENEEVGKITIDKTKKNVKDARTKGPEISFVSNPKFLKSNQSNKLNTTPSQHKVLMNAVSNNTMFISSHTEKIDEDNGGQNTINNKTKLFTDYDNNSMNSIYSIEGKVSQRLEFRPSVSSKDYMNLKKQQFAQKNQPIHVLKQLDKHVQNYKPISRTALHGPRGGDPFASTNDAPSNYKKVRIEKERLMEILFTAFEKHQYYSLKDLVKISEQPVTYIKEVLKEICDYNLKNPHKNMWELKPEYRHYAATE
ncbi:general transcription factor IIF subunit 2-like isoform X2 [Gordionus sp. m RMFG-2023]|uniref:general transcription factor IIF subunit 2-like isoform X2 n=1 Tax=Gordionus sp. m RMFG-2023 TaxID=3053472 RepID=UPI0031FE3523